LTPGRRPLGTAGIVESTAIFLRETVAYVHSLPRWANLAVAGMVLVSLGTLSLAAGEHLRRRFDKGRMWWEGPRHSRIRLRLVRSGQMVAREIEIRPDGETVQYVREATIEPLVLVLNGERFRVRASERSHGDLTDEELWASDDPNLVAKGLRNVTGSWTNIDGEQLNRDISRWRREGNRPIWRPGSA
jgi:hypothetical protein